MRSRIAFCAFVIDHFAIAGQVATVIVPRRKLPMDYWNEYKRLTGKELPDYGFITTEGDYVEADEALVIARNANQLLAGTSIVGNRLSSTNIFTYKSENTR